MDPTLTVCAGAYNQDYAQKFGRKTRALARKRLKVSEDRRSAKEWETEQGGMFHACGVGSPPTGHGFKLISLDDPIKGHEEAASLSYRDRVYEWLSTDIWTRMEPGCQFIICMTLWHVDDCVGRLLKAEDASQWHIVRFPAEAEENDPLGRKVGEPLCPDRFDLTALAAIKRRLGRRQYAALYQQRPVPEEGQHFMRSWFDRTYFHEDDTYYFDGSHKSGVHERDLNIILVVDPALGVKGGDTTGLGVFGVTPDGKILVLESVADRIPIERLWARCLSLIDKWNVQYSLVEANGMQKLVVENLRRHGIIAREIQPGNKNKLMRAQKSIVMAEQGLIFLPDKEEPWVEKWLNEICEFTGQGDESDQQLDCLAYLALETENFIVDGADEPMCWGARPRY